MRQVQRDFGSLITLITAAVMLPVLAITILFLIGIGGPLLAQVDALTTGIAGSGGMSNIETGSGLMLFGTAGTLSIVGAVALALLLRGGGSGPDVERRGPF